jgi:multiple sugar transport system substrate-binding protein
MSIKKPSGRTITTAEPGPVESDPSKRSPLNRRAFLAGAAVLGASLATAGCAGTYDFASGLTGSSGGASNSTLVYWNLLTGGDGTHMEAMEAYYTKTHPGVNLQSTILTWGNPYYTKLAMAIRSGSPPDVAIMHLSRINEFGPPGLLTPLSLDLLAAHGMEPEDFTPLAFSKAHFDGHQLAIPLDTHPFVQYFNTKLCHKAGLLDSSGQLPPITGAQAMLTVLRKFKKLGVTPAVCDQVSDPATAWRLFYTLYSQGGGKVLADNGKKVVLDEALATKVLGFIYQMATEGLMNANVDSNGGTALFQAGDAAFYWEGEWQVDVYQAASLPFSMQPFPALFGTDVAQADSHTFIVPRRSRADPERLSMALTMIRTLLGQSLTSGLLT